MSNIKSVSITAEVDFTFLEEDTEMSANFGRMMVNPIFGLKIKTYELGTYRQNEHGGQTAQIGLQLDGQEAVSSAFLDHLVGFLKQHGKVTNYSVYDIELGVKLV